MNAVVPDEQVNVWCGRCGAWCCYGTRQVSAFCSSRCYWLGRKPTNWDTESRHRIIAYLYDVSGRSTVELGEWFRVGRATIRAALVSRGVLMRNKGGRSYD